MLEELSIRDFAIIDRLSIRFDAGFSVLSGETGAGKSILIGALGFLFGNKADTGIIRAGSDEALVSGVFGADSCPAALAWLKARDIDCEDGTVVIRRSLKRNGRGTVFIQNTPVVRQDLAAFASLLAEMHGQHDQESLMRPERHRVILDRYAGIEDAVDSYGRRYGELCAVRKKLGEQAASAEERARETDLLSFAIEEIGGAAPIRGEEEALAEEERRLSQYEKLFEAVTRAKELVSEGDGVVSSLRKARVFLESAEAIDSRLADTSRRMDDAFYEMEDIADAIRHHADSLSFDPVRLEAIEARQAVLQRLKRKYGSTIEDVLSCLDQSRTRLERLANWDEDRSTLERTLSDLEAEVHEKAKLLSAARKAAGNRLDAQISSILGALGMPNARFAARVGDKAPDQGKAVVGPNGIDEVAFYISANKGEPLKPLTSVASGGELSRIMLALKTVLSAADEADVLIFDEIDAGIGGEVALRVGEHLVSLAAKRQVLCITHLASIAVQADNQYRVEKFVDGERTVTRVGSLSGEDRVREIARMLSGDANAESSTAHAADLLRKYRRSGA